MQTKIIDSVETRDYDLSVRLVFTDGTEQTVGRDQIPRGDFPRVGDHWRVDAQPAGDANDIATEAAIKATGQQGRRVRMEQIDALMAQVQVRTTVIPGTTSTVAAAYLPLPDGRSWTLAIGHSACVDPAMFNAEIGVKVSTEDALAQARKELWKLEGYLLTQAIAADPGPCHAPGTIADEL